MTTANLYKWNQEGNFNGASPAGKETGKAEEQGGGGDGAGGVGGAEGAEAVGEDEAVAEEGEVDGEEEEDEEEEPPEELPEPRGHVLVMMSLRTFLVDALGRPHLAGGLAGLLELKPGMKAGGQFYIMMIQTMTLLRTLRIPWTLVLPGQAGYGKWQKRPGSAISWDGTIDQRGNDESLQWCEDFSGLLLQGFCQRQKSTKQIVWEGPLTFFLWCFSILLTYFCVCLKTSDCHVSLAKRSLIHNFFPICHMSILLQDHHIESRLWSLLVAFFVWLGGGESFLCVCAHYTNSTFL